MAGYKFGLSSITINQTQFDYLTKDEVGKARMIYVAAVMFAKRLREVTGKANGSGRAYRRKNRVHVASAPGQPPTIDYGKLKEGILFDGKNPIDFEVETVSRITGKDVYKVTLPPLGLTLEYGTSEMRARPFIKDSLDYVLRNYLDIIINLPLVRAGLVVR
jgi:hypothetical protein